MSRREIRTPEVRSPHRDAGRVAHGRPIRAGSCMILPSSLDRRARRRRGVVPCGVRTSPGLLDEIRVAIAAHAPPDLRVVMAQGGKRLLLGDQVYEYRAGHRLVVTVVGELPGVGSGGTRDGGRSCVGVAPLGTPQRPPGGAAHDRSRRAHAGARGRHVRERTGAHSSSARTFGATSVPSSSMDRSTSRWGIPPRSICRTWRL